MLLYESCRQLVLIESNTPIWFTKTVRFSAKRITEAMAAHYISSLSQFSFSSSESSGSSASCLDQDSKGVRWSLVAGFTIKPSLWPGFQHDYACQDMHILLQTLTHISLLCRNPYSYPSKRQRLSHAWVPEILMKWWLRRRFEAAAAPRPPPPQYKERYGQNVVTIKKIIYSSTASFLAAKEELAKSHSEKGTVELENSNTCNYVQQNLLSEQTLCQPFISCRCEFTVSNK